MVENEVLETVISKIVSYSGIYVAESQKQPLQTLIQSKADEKKISPKEFASQLQDRTPDFDEIINLVTVNETYFFREEKQFDFLKNVVFPRFVGKNISLWTCCCSTGEEPISLLALALSMGVKLTIYASDIDDNALAKLNSGRYSLYSLRSDGQKYHELLEPYSQRTETEIIFNKDFLNNIHSFKFNLIQDTKLPFFENLEIIFMRNVFIYFDKETRKNVTGKVSERLKDEGMLFFSMNEIGSIDNSIIPEYLTKTNDGVVYYFIRGKRPAPAITSIKDNIQKKMAEKSEEEKKKENQEKLRLEVEKAKTQKTLQSVTAALASASAMVSGGAASAQTGAPAAAHTSAPVDFKQIYEDICAEINKKDFVKARTIARAISGEDYKRYSFFMQGYIEYYADNRTAAEALFAYSETASQDFWPAYFYHGMVLRDMGKDERASYCFKRCKEILTDFGDHNPYDFTLDSFSPSYIYSLCTRFQGGE
ncbi:MAG: hypothetical protein IJ688_12935 [Treponema sp.]|nr:hypothetical protein [Treponema sp.]